MTETDRYVTAVATLLSAGDATEHSYRPAFQSWLESLSSDLIITNEPKRGTRENAPDFDVKIKRGNSALPIGKIETKDVSSPSRLSSIEADSKRSTPKTRDGRQLKRYLAAFSNLILTDYIEFRWYKDGELQQTQSLGTVSGTNLVTSPGGVTAVENLLTDYLAQAPQRVTSSRALAVKLAALAGIIRDVLNHALETKSASDATTGLRRAFGETLVPDLTDSQFADMFAQTLAYGLFAARVQHVGDRKFTRHNASGFVPKSNPFLRGLFTHLTSGALDDEPYVRVVDDIAQLLADSNMEKILRRFGQEKRDPIVHFYETFLKYYDPTVRDLRGVYYTPLPVVDFIIRSVDAVLKESFGLSDGIGDTSRTASGEHKVMLLDPATGTGTFLYSAIALIRDRFIKHNQGALWPSYVTDHILPRFFGFELMVAPYVIAHLKLALQLAGHDLPDSDREDFAYDLEAGERIGVYLTNALDPGEAHTTLSMGKFISDEANAASAVKTEKPIMVIIGNPPYQGESANASSRREYKRTVKGKAQYTKVDTHIGQLMKSYYEVDGKPLAETNTKWLQDDYVKFIRLGQARIDATGTGVLAFVTNHTYLDAPTFRGMRQSLLGTFDDIYVLDLHGSVRRREKSPDGSVDENVFAEIQQGVCIAIFVKTTSDITPGRVHHGDLWGAARDKYDWLERASISDVAWREFVPQGPFYGFRSSEEKAYRSWNSAMSLTEIFPVNSRGVLTSRDSLVIDTRRDRLKARIARLSDLTEQDSKIRLELFGAKGRTTSRGEVYEAGDNRDWKMSEKRRTLAADRNHLLEICPITYRPFDDRWILFHEAAVDNMHKDVMKHMRLAQDHNEFNLALISGRSNKSASADHFFATRFLSEAKTAEASTQSRVFPLWLYRETANETEVSADGKLDLEIAEDSAERRVANLGPRVSSWLSDGLGITLVKEAIGNGGDQAGAYDVLCYVYAIVHSRNYRLT